MAKARPLVNYKPSTRGARATGPIVNLKITHNKKMREQVVEIKARYTRFATSPKGFLFLVNTDSLHYIQGEAKNNLLNSMKANQRPINFRSKRLETAITEDKYSTVTPHYFRFLVRSKIIRKVPYYAAVEHGSYASVGRLIPVLFLGPKTARQLAEGDFYNSAEAAGRSFKNRQKPASFRSNQRDLKTGTHRLGIPERNPDLPNSRGYVTDRIIGKSEYRRKKFTGQRFQPSLLTKRGKGKTFVVVKRPVPEYAYGRKALAKYLATHQFGRLIDKREELIKEQTGLLVAKNNARVNQNSKPARTAKARDPLKGRGKNSDVTVSNIND